MHLPIPPDNEVADPILDIALAKDSTAGKLSLELDFPEPLNDEHLFREGCAEA